MHSFHSNTVRTQTVTLNEMKKYNSLLLQRTWRNYFDYLYLKIQKKGRGKNCHPATEIRLRSKHEQKSNWHWRKSHKGDHEFISQRPSLKTGSLCFQRLHHLVLPQQRALLWLDHHSSFCDPTSFPWNLVWPPFQKGKHLAPQNLSQPRSIG